MVKHHVYGWTVIHLLCLCSCSDSRIVSADTQRAPEAVASEIVLGKPLDLVETAIRRFGYYPSAYSIGNVTGTHELSLYRNKTAPIFVILEAKRQSSKARWIVARATVTSHPIHTRIEMVHIHEIEHATDGSSVRTGGPHNNRLPKMQILTRFPSIGEPLEDHPNVIVSTAHWYEEKGSRAWILPRPGFTWADPLDPNDLTVIVGSEVKSMWDE